MISQKREAEERNILWRRRGLSGGGYEEVGSGETVSNDDENCIFEAT